MQHIYCTNCGSKVSYSGPKPKFCSSCGTPIGGGGLVIKNKINTSEAKTEQQLNDYETDINYVPQIKQLSYDIAQGDSGYKTYKLKDIINVEKEPRSTKDN